MWCCLAYRGSSVNGTTGGSGLEKARWNKNIFFGNRFEKYVLELPVSTFASVERIDPTKVTERTIDIIL